MIFAEYFFHLPISPSVAFSYLANPENDPHWQSSCVSAKLSGATVQVGGGYHIVFNFLGRKMEFECEVTQVQPDSEYAFKVLKGSFHYEGRYSFSPHANGTQVHWQFSAEPGKFFGILPASLLRKVLISQIEKDTVTLAKILSQPVAVVA
jgi:uncharacterized membrane protein